MGRQGVGIILCCFVFVLLLIVLSLLVHDNSSVCFLVPFLLSLSLVPLIRCCWCVEIVVCFVELFQRSGL